MKLRIWHNSNFGHPPFTKEVVSVAQAIEYLDLLADYDNYQGDDKVFANAQGLEMWSEQDQAWENYYDDDGNELEDLRREQEAAATAAPVEEVGA